MRREIAAVGFGLALLVACGGRIDVASSADAGVSVGVSGSSRDAADGARAPDAGATDFDFPVCPARPPTEGTDCFLKPPNNGCRYVGPASTTCEAFVCTAAGWSRVQC